MTVSDLERTLLDSWKEEIEAATVYSRLAERETHQRRQAILRELAATEERHAVRWAEQLRSLGVETPDPGTVRLPTAMELSLRFAPLDALIAHQEVEERRMAGEHAVELGRPDLDAVRSEIAREDAEHADTLAALLEGMGLTQGSRAAAKTTFERLIKRETWHSQSGGWISGAIYGVNDGLAAVFGIVSGTAAAFSSDVRGSHIVLVAGLAGAIASALSMGCGAFLATKSELEVHDAQVHRERRELEEDPEGERLELELIYQLKGLPDAEAKMLADRVSKNPDLMLTTKVQEELGLGEKATGDPIRSGAAAAVSTALGAVIPVLPFFFLTGAQAIVTAAVVSIVAHFLVGAAKSVVTLRTWWASGIEMTVAGIIVGAATYIVGLAIKLAGA